ncbi:MAG: hypothetical protein UT37_C0001G0015 [Parcubacteria group bacterium GW2011_GWA2_39_18]|nr:MAG: hypothetical protein UT37_C0001G0015 [Parcubacteria group bacterium GW2011_GWA2_39_18]
MDRKKIIIISSVGVGALILVGILIYLIVPKNASIEQPALAESPEASVPSGANLNLSQNSVLNEILPANIVSFVWSDMDQKFVAISSNGFLYSINPNDFGVSTTTNFDVSNIIKVAWSPDKSKALVYYSENNILKKFYFDVASQNITPLNDQIGDAIFSPKGDQILYVFNQSQNNVLKSFLSLSNPDGTKWKNIATFSIPDALLYWPSGTNVRAYATSPASGLLSNSVYSIDIKNGSLQKFLIGQNGQQIKLSSSGNGLLSSFVDSRGRSLQLFYKNLQTNSGVLLPIKTLPEKCSFDATEENIFCAVPNKISSSAIMPDDYYGGRLNYADSLWVYNIESNSASQATFSESVAPINIRALEVSFDSSYIIFISQKDGKLFRLQIR